MDKIITVTSSQMKEIERRAAEGGLSYYQMMENAGTAAAEYIIGREQVSGENILIFCGKGNNGGDGFVVARKLTEKNAKVRVILVEGEPKTEDAIKNKQICETIGIGILDAEENDTTGLIHDAGIIVDAIYGTGFHGELREKARNTTRSINGSKARIYALDIPSGLNGDDGSADCDTIRACATVAFHRFKPGHLMDLSKGYCGDLCCADIGIQGI